MKKKYQAPEIKIVNVKSNTLLSGSTVNAVNTGGIFRSTVEAGAVSARSRSFDDDWDDDE